MAPKEKPDFSESDRAALETLLREREFERRLAERRKTIRDGIKNGSQLITAVALVFTLGRDVLGLAWEWIKQSLNGGP